MDPSMGSDPAAGFGAGNPFANFHPSGVQPRITPEGFTVSWLYRQSFTAILTRTQVGIFTVLAISIITILARVALRLQRTHSLAFDDYFLIVALITLVGACAVQQHYRDITYMILNTSSGNEIPPASIAKDSVTETQILTATSVLLWTSIFCVKFSFLFFFRKLISRLRALQIYWWVVFAVVLAGALTSIPMSFFECAYFGDDLLAHCPVDSLIARERIYLDVTITLDILTDVLIISLPIALLWNVKIDLQKKLTLIGIFGLSIVMIVIALIRVAMAPLTPTVIDTPFMFFLQILEAGIALVMVSVSAFRGLFGQAGAPSYHQGGNAYAGNAGNANRRGAPDAEKGASSASSAPLHPTISAPRDLSVLASGSPKGGSVLVAAQPMQEAGFEMGAIAPQSQPHGRDHASRRQTTYEERQKDLPMPPGTPGREFGRSESPTTTRCWSDAPAQRERSLSRAGSIREKVKHIRAKSRSPSMGEVLIEEHERKGNGRAVPRDYV